MPEEGFRFGEVALPVPVDRLFTYELPANLQPPVQIGCRVWVPFGKRRLTGVVLRLHNDAPAQETRQVLRVLDAEPVLDAELLNLGRWLAEYYCAPLGEVLKSMLPLSGELRQSTLYSLTEEGRDAARQLILEAAVASLLQLIEKRPRSATYLAKKVAGARTLLRDLVKKGWLIADQTQRSRTRRPAESPTLAKDPRPSPVLNADQQTAAEAIRTALQSNSFRTFLLQGVTGSGKTEVYLRSIETALALGKNALLLVPEIGLTPAMAGQFFERFGEQVAILHSAFGDAERAEQWRRVRSGSARVVIGTRSGVFAPIQNLGLIVIDEEHDSSYKQQETPRYHARDVALMRAREAGAVAVLGSATPAVETRYNAEQGKYRLLLLPSRIAQRPLPEVHILDMRLEFLETKRQSIFSRKLIEEIERRLAQQEQTMLLLNRRGFSSFMICRSCGERLLCANCSVVLTQHRRDRRMLCHYCGYAEKIPQECPKCGSDYIQFLGSGSERVEDTLHEHFPQARIARLDRDSARGKGTFARILQSFRDGEIDILVGTQMIAKGHDVPNVTLVGVVLADIGLSLPDFRAAERSFELLTQAAGRAGRGDTPGRVLVQTFNPDHYAVRFAAQQDYEAFYKKEIEFRKWLRYPPFAALASVLVRAERQEQALRMASALGIFLNPPAVGVRVIGPAEAPVLRLKKEFRYQVLLKAASRAVLRRIVNDVRAFAEKEKWNATALVIDVDPISFV